YLDVQDAGPAPVPPPPVRRVEAPRLILNPPLAKVRGNRAVHLAHQSGAGDPDRAARLDEPGEVAQVQVVRAVIDEGIDGDDGVEEFRGERQRPRVGVDGKDPVLDAGIPDALEV